MSGNVLVPSVGAGFPRPEPGAETAPLHSVLFSRLLTLRGLTDPEKIESFLHPRLEDLKDPFHMKGVSEACLRLQKAVQQKEKILIHGDYDVDGVTGAAILSRTLRILGANFRCFLPDRAEDGYGVSEQAIRKAIDDGTKLLITVDCGITAKKEIQIARDHGLEIIVLDHHRLPADGLPPAHIILNPLQLDCPYPFKELSAAGLAFKLSQALMGEKAYELLDLAALSTVCDVAPLTDENRIIVKFGLERMAKRKNPGLRALGESAKLKSHEVNVGHLGFIFGPRINAAGRMSSPEIALQLLLTEQTREAESLAQILEEENKARRSEEQKVVREAIREVERTFNFNRDRVIVTAREGWHQGVIGIVAARLVDKFHRPAIVIAIDKGIGKGSGRSIKKFNLFQALEASSDQFEEFGGHAQAAGLVIQQNKIVTFREKINTYARENHPPELFKKEVAVDMEIRLEDLRPAFIRELKLLEPHGAGNPRPVFSTRGLYLKGKPNYLSPQSLQLWITDGAVVGEAILNNPDDLTLARLNESKSFDIAYSLKIKTQDGLEHLMLEIKEII